MMGQKSRSGPGPYRTFEGGQNRLVKRMPFKRGFTNIWQVEYQVVNLGALEAWPADLPVTSETLEKEGLISHRKAPLPLKILGDGELTTALTVHAHKFSASARQKIESTGGKVIEIPLVIERRSRSHGPNPSMRKTAPQSN